MVKYKLIKCVSRTVLVHKIEKDIIDAQMNKCIAE